VKTLIRWEIKQRKGKTDFYKSHHRASNPQGQPRGKTDLTLGKHSILILLSHGFQGLLSGERFQIHERK